MPELPEVETMRRGLIPVIGGRIELVEFPKIPYRPIGMSPAPSSFRRRLLGRSIIAVDRIAKRVLVRLDNGDSLVMQPKMAGLVLIAEPPSEQHVRMIVHVGGARCDRFMYWDRRGLGTLHVWNENECERFLGAAVLGPDALEVDPQRFLDLFGRLKRPVKPALLDQKRVAGVGNLYASEILHRAKVHPEVRCDALSNRQWFCIHENMREILLAAIEAEGSTLGDGTYRNAVNGEGGFQLQHRVYARQDQTCMTCHRGVIVRIVQAQRSTFYCPNCQRKRVTR